MSVSIQFLNAHHGDAIFISVKLGLKTTRILIDGGPPYTFKPRENGRRSDGDLKRLLDELRSAQVKIDLVILTHVDDDHIGGLIKAFEAPGGLGDIADKVIFNSGRLIHEYFDASFEPEKDIKGNFNQSQNTSISQGNTLEEYLTHLGIWHRKIVKQGCVYNINDCVFTFLGPDENDLKKLLAKWEKDQGRQFTSAPNGDWAKTYEELLRNDAFEEDDSKTNGSSISFILQCGALKFLFLGDAHPSTVISGLSSLEYTEENPLRVELFKVAHHGSKGNTSVELLKLVSTSMYVISTDGSRHGLPDKVTLARIHKMAPNAEIHFNYGRVIENIYTKDEACMLGDKIQIISGELKFG
ncbi:MAG TPA: MBL fold metallo-hydrolase [Cellvibrio sp.]|nr:MBL fold metallo-hydrolase [Cellvibrio sp.]